MRVDFKVGTNIDNDNVLIQNRLTQATPFLPSDVQALGQVQAFGARGEDTPRPARQVDLRCSQRYLPRSGPPSTGSRRT